MCALHVLPADADVGVGRVVRAGSSSPVLLEHVSITDACGNSAISVQDSALMLTDVQLSRNTAPTGAAVYGLDSRITCVGVIADDNAASDTSGGAFWASGCDIRLTDTVLAGNRARVFGGAVMLEFSALTTSRVTLANNRVSHRHTGRPRPCSGFDSPQPRISRRRWRHES